MKKFFHQLTATFMSFAVVLTLGSSFIRADSDDLVQIVENPWSWDLGLLVNEGEDQITLTGIGTYTLEEDLTIPIVMTDMHLHTSEITIDLNGHSIKTDGVSAISTSGPAELTIIGDGSVYSSNADAVIASRLVIKGGKYTATGKNEYGEDAITLWSTSSMSISDGAVVTGPVAVEAILGDTTVSGSTINGDVKLNALISDSSSTINGDVILTTIGGNADENSVIDGTNISGKINFDYQKREERKFSLVIKKDGTAADSYILTSGDETLEVETFDNDTVTFGYTWIVTPVWEASDDSGETTTTTTTSEPAAPVHIPDAYDFVDRLYHIALGRDSDEAGRNYWLGALNNGEKSGSEVAYGFFFSPEFVGTGYSNVEYVESLYNAILGRYSDPEGLANWVNALNNGMTREEVFNGFVTSPEFSELCSSYGVKA